MTELRTHGTPRQVLYIVPNAFLGGAERAVSAMTQYATEQFPPTVLFLNDGPLVEVFKERKIPTFLFPFQVRLRNPFQIIRCTNSIRKLIKERNIEIINSTMPYAHIFGSLAAVGTQARTILWQHGPVGGLLGRVAAHLPTTAVVANSKFTMAAHNKISQSKAKRYVISLGTDLELSDVERIRYRTELNNKYALSDENLVCAVVARLVATKGIDLAIEGASRVLKENPNMRLFIVGGELGPGSKGYKKKLERLAASLGVEAQVVFTGFIEDMRKMYARLDIVINSSTDPEWFGLSNLEAMAAGSSVLVSRLGGIVELFEDEKEGLFFNPGDVADLERKLRKFVENPAMRESMAKSAKGLIENKFRIPQFIQAQESIYRELISKEAEYDN